MTTALATPPAYRAAGSGALLAGLAYLCQPLLGAVLASGVEPTTGADLAAVQWSGVAQLAVFTTTAVGTALLVTGVDRLLPAGPGAQLVRWLGLLSATGWALVGAASVGLYGPVSSGMAETVPDPGAQAAAIAAGYTAITGMVALAAVGAVGWLAGLATLGRKAGVVGTPLAVAAGVAALVIAAVLLLMAAPFGALVLIPVHLALGVAFLRRGRADRRG